jgi:hypothetical protein
MGQDNDVPIVHLASEGEMTLTSRVGERPLIALYLAFESKRLSDDVTDRVMNPRLRYPVGKNPPRTAFLATRGLGHCQSHWLRG